MQLPKGWDNCELLLRAVNARGVEYLNVGSMAKSHFRPILSVGDMDLLVNPTPENATRMQAAIDDVNWSLYFRKGPDYHEKLVERNKQLIHKDINAHILTPTFGFNFNSAFSRSIETEVTGGIQARIASVHDLETLDALRRASEPDERPN